MDIVAHSWWTGAAVVTAKRATEIRPRLGWSVFWGIFPDLMGFGPGIIAGFFVLLTQGPGTGPAHHLLPRVHLGLPLYAAAHSLITFLCVFGVVSLLARRVVFPMLGWLLHILIDIPTHSEQFYATRFLWPVSDVHVDGIAWWTPWFWAATYVALAVVYALMWRRGWLSPVRPPKPKEAPSAAVRL